jgi:hypothetical protein
VSDRATVFETRGLMRDALAKARSVREAVAASCGHDVRVDWDRDRNVAAVTVPLDLESRARGIVEAVSKPRQMESRKAAGKRDPKSWMSGRVARG